MPSGIALDKARLLGAFLACIAFGLFTAFFAAALYYVVKRGRKSNPMLLVTLVCLYLLATTHLSMVVAAAFDAFINSEESAVAYYLHALSHPFEVAEAILLDTTVLIADAFLIYRVYIVWGRQWWITVAPILCWIGAAIGGYGTPVALATTPPGAEIFIESVVPWMTTIAIMTFATNAICTGLIAFKMHSIQRRLKGVGGLSSDGSTMGAAHHALTIMIESAALYLATVTVFLVLYLSRSNGQYAVLAMAPHILGLVFTAIIIRISLGLSTIGGTSTATTASSRQIITIGGTRRLGGPNPELELDSRSQHVAVHVDQLVESDQGSMKARERQVA